MSDEIPEASEGVIALCAAATKVRDGEWVGGAPSHIFAEMLKALEDDGWFLRRHAPTMPELIPNIGDIVIVLRKGGRAAAAYVRRSAERMQELPLRVEMVYAPPPARSLTPIRTKVTAGWTTAQWKKEHGDRVPPWEVESDDAE